MSISFTKTGLTELVAALEPWKQPQTIADRILSRLCDIGVEAIKKAYADDGGAYSGGNYQRSGTSAASVRKEDNGDGRWSIVAESEGLLYLEFGAGVARNPDGGAAARLPLNKIDTGNASIDAIGSRGQGLGANPNGWNYYKDGLRHYTLGTKARHGFADAITAIYAAKDQVIREEIGK